MEGSRPAMATNSDDESQVNWEVFPAKEQELQKITPKHGLKVCAVFLAKWSKLLPWVLPWLSKFWNLKSKQTMQTYDPILGFICCGLNWLHCFPLAGFVAGLKSTRRTEALAKAGTFECESSSLLSLGLGGTNPFEMSHFYWIWMGRMPRNHIHAWNFKWFYTL